MNDRDHEKPQRVERRQFFRVEDVLPVVLKKAHNLPSEVKARVLSAAAGPTDIRPSEAGPVDGIPARLWEMLVDIQAKLDMILEGLSLQEGLPQPESKLVFLSATGMRLRVDEDLSIGDFVEIRLSLTLQRPIWLALYGEVIRVRQIPDGTREIAVRFAEMDGSIRDTIAQYVLKRQRELIRSLGKQKEPVKSS